MFYKWLSRCQARWSKFLFYFNFKNNYKLGSQCEANALTRESQDLPTHFDFCQNYIKQIVFIPNNLSIVQPIQTLRQGDIRSIDAVKQDLESSINNAYQKINSKDPVVVIS